MRTKYIFVTGGVVSALGKGITAASLGRLLKNRGLSVKMQKFDPYINVDPGTMSPYQHGEVYVTVDGAETDLDLGHYERFIDEELRQNSNVTTGKVYQTVIDKERDGNYYLGSTVQVVPHITNEIKNRIVAVEKEALEKPDVVITEIGGTVGDIESQPFLEAIRQMYNESGKGNCMYIHCTLVPYLRKAGELKSKPTQHSVKELRSIGIQPDVIVARAEMEIGESIKKKISLFCNIKENHVIQNIDADVLYEVPLLLEKENLDDIVVETLNLDCPKADMTDWRLMIERIKKLQGEVNIALVGKYVALHDAYLSVAEALEHGGIENGTNVKIKWVLSDNLNDENVAEKLGDVDGILVPGGFGNRGIEGKVAAAKFARENKIPYFGICLGMQTAVIEFARNMCSKTDANSTEFDPDTPHPVIDIMAEQKDIDKIGGTMRLGAYPCEMVEGTRAEQIYAEKMISERHRHRYEFNNAYIEEIDKAGMKVCGYSPDKKLVEMVEITDHPWYVACQFHPEFQSRPNRVHPLFASFIKASKENKRK